MNRRSNHSLIATLAAVLAASFFCPRAHAYLVPLTPDGTGTYNIAAVQTCVTLNNPRLNAAAGGAAGAGAQNVYAWVYWDPTRPALPSCLNTNTCTTNNDTALTTGIPIPVLRLTAGQFVTVKFQNKLPKMQVCNNNNNMEGVSIHWHGIELDNDSDGTAVTQDSVFGPGETYTYRFKAPRPGLFWFHSHMVPGDALFAGMYGILIVTDSCEANLIANNKIPASNSYPPPTNSIDSTFPLALSDIEWDTIATNATFGQVGRVDLKNIDGGGFKSINQWIKDCGNNSGGGQNNPCGGAQYPGETVLVNGANPDTMANLVTWNVVAGQTIRLQLFNEALTRNFDLYLWNPATQTAIPLVRIGGQGGLLNNARLEGGILSNPNGPGGGDSGWNSQYVRGDISLSSGVRADATACVPNQTNITLTLLAVNNTAQWPLQRNNLGGGVTGNPANGYTIPPVETKPQPIGTRPLSYPIAYFNVVAPPPNTTLTPCIVSNTPILAALGTNVCPRIGTLTNGSGTDTNSFIGPAGPNRSVSTTIQLATVGGNPSIDASNIRTNNFLDGNDGDGEFVNDYPAKTLPTDRYATVGSLLVLSVYNTTGNGVPIAHPFHWHGFSIQPLAIINGDPSTPPAKNLYTFDYNEFIDTIDIYSGQTLVFAVRLEDREKFCDSATGGPQLQPCLSPAVGGALGRWLYHCHIANHGVLGMMGEFYVVPNVTNAVMVQQPPDTTPTGVDVLATAGTASQTVADDFQWVNPGGPITNVIIWGSWLHDLVDPNTTFELKFWTDVPSANGPFSRPGWQAWQRMFPPGTYTNYGYTFVSGGEYFYAPGITNIPAGDTQVYQYGFPIPLNAGFSPQVINGTNWLSITAHTVNSNALFGWKSSILGTGWNDDSTWSSTTWGPPWSELLYVPPHPYYPASMNQAFALYVVPSGVGPGTPALPTSRPAVTLDPPVLSATVTDGNINISWSNGGILQSGDTPNGPWTDVGGIPNPYVAPATNSHQFYRVRVPQ